MSKNYNRLSLGEKLRLQYHLIIHCARRTDYETISKLWHHYDRITDASCGYYEAEMFESTQYKISLEMKHEKLYARFNQITQPNLPGVLDSYAQFHLDIARNYEQNRAAMCAGMCHDLANMFKAAHEDAQKLSPPISGFLGHDFIKNKNRYIAMSLG